MSRPKHATARKSPYVKYSKAPYAYSFKGCNHRNTVFQSIPGWRGTVCQSCNTIVGNTQKRPR